jgi:XrtN system VIT domain protein
MRLFAYNRILQRTGRDVLAEILNEEGAIAEAQEAYVVSPFSSLVVLETARDYERFDIASSKNSLQNASLKSQGAVPEPHEWALIVVVILLFGFLKFYPMTILVKRQ